MSKISYLRVYEAPKGTLCRWTDRRSFLIDHRFGAAAKIVMSEAVMLDRYRGGQANPTGALPAGTSYAANGLNTEREGWYGSYVRGRLIAKGVALAEHEWPDAVSVWDYIFVNGAPKIGGPKPPKPDPEPVPPPVPDPPPPTPEPEPEGEGPHTYEELVAWWGALGLGEAARIALRHLGLDAFPVLFDHRITMGDITLAAFKRLRRVVRLVKGGAK